MAALAHHEFSCSLYKTLAAENQGNLFLSPLSIAAAMAMVYMGTEGDTAKELETVMKWEQPTQKSVAEEYNKAVTKLTSASENLKLANKLWLQKDLKVKSNFMDVLKTSFQSEVGLADFKGNSNIVKEEINKWVKEKTSDLIKELVKDGMLNGQTRLFLVNAIYFKAMWENKFHEGNTHEADFHVDEAKTVTVKMMYQNGKILSFYDDVLKCVAVELPYAGGKYAMTFVLPEEGTQLSALEKQLSPSVILKFFKNVNASSNIDIFIPRFKVGFETQLVDTFKKLGLSQLFDDRADLSGIVDDERLFVSNIIHKSFIDVNEEGTEAAAATGAQIMLMMMPPQIILNRPFLFMIRDVHTGMVIFMGKVTDPTSS